MANPQIRLRFRVNQVVISVQYWLLLRLLQPLCTVFLVVLDPLLFLGVLSSMRLSLQLMVRTCLSRLLDCMSRLFIWRTLRLSSRSQ
ncbi:hypothetical protein Plhal703r1_c51g0155641 [Plasmopara halstedii]